MNFVMLCLGVIFSNLITDVLYKVLAFIIAKTKTKKDDKALVVAKKVVAKIKSKTNFKKK